MTCKGLFSPWNTLSLFHQPHAVFYSHVLFEQPAGLHLVKIQTSSNDRMLWALDNRGNVHVRTGITEEMPVGTAWEHIPGTPSSHNLIHCFYYSCIETVSLIQSSTHFHMCLIRAGTCLTGHWLKFVFSKL